MSSADSYAQRDGAEGKKSRRCKVGGIGRREGGREGGWGGRGKDPARLKRSELVSEMIALSFVLLEWIFSL